MSATNFLEDKFLLSSLNGNTYTGSANVYVALYSSAPGESGSGTELSGSGYSRQVTAFSVNTGNGVATNTGNVVFGNATADWSTAVAYGIVDASTAGNILYSGALAPTLTLKNAYNLTFPVGNITVTVN
jgi:hypothetical protein